jgi:peptidoglycan/LPS O-acetylase OafA/YrhL
MVTNTNVTYHPSLDGVRALAIIAVLLYHGGVAWAGGGFLGVEVFFVLSGYLITSLLVAEWTRDRMIRLGRFWARRARRLLPALFALVFVVGAYYVVAGPLGAVPGLKQSALATLLYVGNWHQIATGASYFVASGPVSPLQHTWSLAIEEQFYLIWPLLLVSVFWLLTRSGFRHFTPRRSLQAMLIVTVAGAVGSLAEMTVLYRGGAGLERIYYGTDTRAAGLLIGSSLAIAAVLYGDRLAKGRRSGRRERILAWAALALLGTVVAAMHFASGESSWLFPWGLIATDGAVAVVIAGLTLLPSSPVARLFSTPVLCAIGRISYGLYLWHFPCFVWLDHGTTGLGGARLLMLRVATTFAAASLSYVLIEQPIRQRRLPRWALRPILPVAAAATLGAVLAAGAIGAQMPGGQFAPIAPAVAAAYTGGAHPCRVHLRDSSLYRTAPLPAAQTGGYIFHWILRGSVDWNSGGYRNSASLTFHTCPPIRALFIGDSIAFTAGVPMLHRENRYGVEVADSAILGCAFGTRGKLEVSGVFTSLPSGCPSALEHWRQAELRFHAQVVLVELGYRDEFNWSWHGRVVHLGHPGFDAYVTQQVARFVRVLGEGGTRVLFLSVPYVQPPALPDGSPAPAGSSSRHALINSILGSAARTDPTHVRVLDVDKIVSPGNRYTASIHGNACRFDGIHFTIYCASLLQPYVLSAARALVSG